MDDLKNLVIQTLETKGILGKIRAQLRSCVFQVVDSQDQDLKQGSGFQWQNPMAKQMVQTPQGELLADLVREFLEFYRMDYSLAVYLPEANIGQEPKKREDIERKAGFEEGSASNREPLLLQILRSHLDRKKEPQQPQSLAQQIQNKTPSPPPMQKEEESQPIEEEKSPLDETNEKEKRDLHEMEKKLQEMNVEKVQHIAEFKKESPRQETEESQPPKQEEKNQALQKASLEDEDQYYNQDFEQECFNHSDLEESNQKDFFKPQEFAKSSPKNEKRVMGFTQQSPSPNPLCKSGSMGNDPLVDEEVLAFFDEIEEVQHF